MKIIAPAQKTNNLYYYYFNSNNTNNNNSGNFQKSHDLAACCSNVNLTYCQMDIPLVDQWAYFRGRFAGWNPQKLMNDLLLQKPKTVQKYDQIQRKRSTNIILAMCTSCSLPNEVGKKMNGDSRPTPFLLHSFNIR